MTDPLQLHGAVAQPPPQPPSPTPLYRSQQNTTAPIPFNVSVRTPMAGLGELVNALMNGYVGYKAQQASQYGQPSYSQPNFLTNLFGPNAPSYGGVMPSPSTDGGLY